MKRMCPACLARRARLVDPACLVCRGAGVLTLGDDAVEEHGPESVSRAVSIALEAAARSVDTPGIDPTYHRAAVRGAVQCLRTAGLLTGGKITRTTKATARGASSASLAHAALGLTIQPQDWILPDAPAYRYRPDERPGARGLPVLSDDGHPSHLARICDPAEALDTSTAQDVYRRAADHRRAVLLAMRATDS